ncbi:hypothetical protein P9477_09640 [Enterobacter mori]|uniref:hypothetical protein n=1 Tax=Enterobacter mori TaxID=539813 RepID=UPI00398AE218
MAAIRMTQLINHLPHRAHFMPHFFPAHLGAQNEDPRAGLKSSNGAGLRGETTNPRTFFAYTWKKCGERMFYERFAHHAHFLPHFMLKSA